MSAPTPAHEHEFEAAHGLPEPLPRGEHILWQGSPDWRTLAVQVMHVRTQAFYFAVPVSNGIDRNTILVCNTDRAWYRNPKSFANLLQDFI